MNNKVVFTILISVITLLSACQSSNSAIEQSLKPKETIPEHQIYVKAGDTLPLKSITDIEDNVVNLESTDKKKLVILFATWCPDSNRLLKALNNSPLLNDNNIEVIAISREESSDVVEAWALEHDIKTPLALDIDRSIFSKFASGGIPRIITVSRDNKIIKMSLEEGQEQLSHIQW